MRGYEKTGRIAVYITANSRAHADQQIEKTIQYLKREWNITFETSTIEKLKDVLDDHTTVELLDGAIVITARRSDRTDRDGMNATRKIGALVGADEKQRPGHIIVATIADLTQGQAREIVETGINLHCTTTRIRLAGRTHGMDAVVKQIIRKLTGEAMDADTILEGIPHRGGRPPVGTTSDDGTLKRAGRDDPGPTYEAVRQSLQKVEKGAHSKKFAAERLGVCRKTIDNALERRELYQLDNPNLRTTR